MWTPETEIVSARVVASSIIPSTGARVDTLHVRYPRLIHAEVMTHRVFSRNTASSRAIPVSRMLARNETYTPHFKHNKKGMQPADYLSDEKQVEAEQVWLNAANACRAAALSLSGKHLNVSKQWANRMLEWFSWVDVLITSTQWANFFALRLDEDAQDEIRMLARAVWYARQGATPHELSQGEWHLPYVMFSDAVIVDGCLKNGTLPMSAHTVFARLRVPHLAGVGDRDKLLLAISAARCCRVSYGNMNGEPPSLDEDMKLFLKLAGGQPIHASPMEHQAGNPFLLEHTTHLAGNLPGFVQFRQTIPGNVISDADPDWDVPFLFALTAAE